MALPRMEFSAVHRLKIAITLDCANEPMMRCDMRETIPNAGAEPGVKLRMWLVSTFGIVNNEARDAGNAPAAGV